MNDPVRLRGGAVTLRRNERYFLDRMLMRRERLTRAQWDVLERAAEALCAGLLERLPVDHPGPAVWDNRRRPGRR